MIALISPAKNMRPRSREGVQPRRPLFGQSAGELLEKLRDLAPAQLESLMGINPELALTACAYFAQCDLEAEGWTALTAYNGLQYKNIEPETLTGEEFDFLREHLFILSGFYGLVRPDDGIQPYRLEMGGKLRFGGKNLDQFWGDRLYRTIFEKGQPVIDLASAEYSRAVSPFLKKEDQFIRCDFLVRRKGALKTLATEAKMARGRMVRAIAQNRWDAPEELKAFCWNGYAFSAALSDSGKMVFVKE